jgi:hypothetical protein
MLHAAQSREWQDIRTLLVSVLALAIATAASSAAGPECTCDVAEIEGGVPIESALLFEVLDAHGHDIALEAVTCPTCRAAVESDGFCETCGIGWIGGRAYMSRLTYHIFKGQTVPLGALACPTCRANAARSGWCERHGVGMIGNVAITDQADFRHAAKAFLRLLDAVQLARSCEMCAVALMSDGTCTRCKKTYRDGRVVEAGKPPAAPVRPDEP